MHGGLASGSKVAGDVAVDEAAAPNSVVDLGPVLHLAEGVLPLVIADRPVLFVEATQRLNALNGSAGMLVALLADGIGLAELRRELHAALGLSPAEVDALVADWSTQRIVAAAFAPRAEGAGGLSLHAGRREIAIRFPQGGWGAELAAPYAHLSAAGPDGGRSITNVTVEAMGDGPNDLAGIFDARAGTLTARAAAAPILRGAIVDLVLDQPEYVALHAACLVDPDVPEAGAILLIGAPGAGKSTLAAMAGVAGGGLRLAGDDIVLFDPRTGLVMGVPLPLTVKSGSWDRLDGVLPNLAAQPPILRADGQWLRYAPLPPRGSGAAAPGWHRVAVIVDLRRQEDVAAEAIPQSPIECLGRLLEEGFVQGGRCTSAQMRGLARMVDNAEACALRYAEAKQALPWIEALLG